MVVETCDQSIVLYARIKFNWRPLRESSVACILCGCRKIKKLKLLFSKFIGHSVRP